MESAAYSPRACLIVHAAYRQSSSSLSKTTEEQKLSTMVWLIVEGGFGNRSRQLLVFVV